MPAGWSAGGRAGSFCRITSWRVPPPVKRAAETLVADTNNLKRIDRLESRAALRRRAGTASLRSAPCRACDDMGRLAGMQIERDQKDDRQRNADQPKQRAF